MLSRIRIMGWFILASVLLLNGCSESTLGQTEPQRERIQVQIYSGITMIKPLRELKTRFEQRHPSVEIKIIQGASSFLWQALQKEQTGDIYFPGSEAYRLANEETGLFKEHVLVGYNRVALVLAQNNPKQLTDDLMQLLDPKLSVVLSTPESGSIGKATRKLLDKLNITESAYLNATFLTTDSHRINDAIVSNRADLALNWYATTKWENRENEIDSFILPADVSPPRRLELNLMSFASQPEWARKFMQLCISDEGLNTFYRYGFFTTEEYNQKRIELLQSTPSPKPTESLH